MEHGKHMSEKEMKNKMAMKKVIAKRRKKAKK